MRVLIDANVILDLVGKRSPFYISASKTILLSAEKKIEGFITSNTVTDIYYIACRHYTNESDARDIIQKLLRIVGVLDVGYKDCIKAFDLLMQDYEDALLSVCAYRAKCDYIVTRDIDHFSNSLVKAITPDDFISKHFPDYNNSEED